MLHTVAPDVETAEPELDGPQRRNYGFREVVERIIETGGNKAEKSVVRRGHEDDE